MYEALAAKLGCSTNEAEALIELLKTSLLEDGLYEALRG